MFLNALEAEEGLIDAGEDLLDTGELPNLDQTPILLAASDNGAPMTADGTEAFMALCSIAQHFGRPGVLTDQAPIESFFGHIKGDWPHLEEITDPEILGAKLERVRIEYNGIRRSASATSPPTTKTKEEEKSSVKPAKAASPGATRPGETYDDPRTARGSTLRTETPVTRRVKEVVPFLVEVRWRSPA